MGDPVTRVQRLRLRMEGPRAAQAPRPLPTRAFALRRTCCCCPWGLLGRGWGCFHPLQRLGSPPRCYGSEPCSSGRFSCRVEEAHHSTPHRDKRKSEFSVPGNRFYSPRQESGTNYIHSRELRGRAVPLATQGPPFPPPRDLPSEVRKQLSSFIPFPRRMLLPREER